MVRRLNKGKDLFNIMMKGRTLRAISTITALGVAAGVLAQGMTFDAVKKDIKSNINAWKIVVGADAKASDVIGAVEIGSALTTFNVQKTQLTSDAVQVVLEKQTSQLAGAAKLWTDVDKIYLGESITQGGVDALKEGDLPGLATVKVTDSDDVEHNLKFFIKPVSGTIEFKFDSDSGYLGTVISYSGGSDVLDFEVVFEPQVDFTKLAGKEITLFGKKFIVSQVSGEVDANTLTLYEGQESVDVYMDSPQTITIDGKDYKVEVVGWSEDGSKVYVKLTDLATGNSQTEEAPVDNSAELNFDQLGVKLFSKDAKVIKTGADTYNVYVSLWIGYDKYILTGGKIYKGEVNTDNEVKGLTYELPTGTDFTSATKITFKFIPSDLRSDLSTFKQTNILKGEEVEVPIFGFKLVYEGPSIPLKEGKDLIKVSSDKKNVYVEYKGDKVYFAHWNDDGDNSVESGEIETTDMDGNAWVFVEGQPVVYDHDNTVTETTVFYTLANPGVIDEAKLLKVEVSEDEADGSQVDVKIYDALTGDLLAEAKNVDTTAGSTTVYIGTKEYTINLAGNSASNGDTISIEYAADGATAVFPVVKLDDGELLVLANSVQAVGTLDATNGPSSAVVLLPTGEVKFTVLQGDGTNTVDRVEVDIGNDGTADVTVDGGNTAVIDVGGVKYYVSVTDSSGSNADGVISGITLAIEPDQDAGAADGQTTPAVVIVEPKDIIAGEYAGATVVELKTGTEELEPTVASVTSYGSAVSAVSDTNAYKDYYLTKWGTFVEYYDPTSTGSVSEVEAYVPADKVYYEVYVAEGQPQTVTETKTVGKGDKVDDWTVKDIKVEGLPSEVITQVAPLIGVAVLDTEVDPETADKVISVGGPAVNRLTAYFLGLNYPTYGAELQAQGILSPGQAIVQVAEKDGRVAVLVYGWDAMDTRRASRALAQYLAEDMYGDAFEGAKKVEVGSTLTSPSPTKVE